MGIDEIIDIVEEIAAERLQENPGCPGGIVTKFYSVLVDIGVRVGELMAEENLRRRGKEG